jgi:hypothetical protein
MPESEEIEKDEEEIVIENMAKMIAGEIRKEIIKYLFGEDAIDIEPSEWNEWNAIIYRDWGGERCFRDFRTGGYSDYVAFSIKLIKALIEELKAELEWFERKDREIEELWRAKMGYENCR